MSTNTARRVPSEQAATQPEIIAAIESLSEADVQRLMRFARRRLKLIGNRGDWQTPEELYRDAITDLLIDTRRWNKSKVDFVGCLTGIIKSKSSNAAKAYLKGPVPATDLERETDEGQVKSILDQVSDTTLPPDLAAEYRDTLSFIEEVLKDDEEALQVLESMKDRQEPREIRETWGMSQDLYNAVIRRMRRRLHSLGLSWSGPKGGNYVN